MKKIFLSLGLAGVLLTANVNAGNDKDKSCCKKGNAHKECKKDSKECAKDSAKCAKEHKSCHEKK